MIPLADLLQTKNHAFKTLKTWKAQNADGKPEPFMYSQKMQLHESHGKKKGKPGIGKPPLRGQKSLSETTDQGELPPASPGATVYQVPASFETCYQRCLADLGGKYRASMGEVLTDQEREEEGRIEADIERLWFLGVSQDEAGAAGTYQEFRAAVIRWYRLWIRGIERCLPAGPTSNQANPEPGEEWKQSKLTEAQVSAELRALQVSGKVPSFFTKAVTCAGCGPVFEREWVDTKPETCCWCYRRAKGLPIPRPGAVRSGDDRAKGRGMTSAPIFQRHLPLPPLPRGQEGPFPLKCTGNPVVARAGGGRRPGIGRYYFSRGSGEGQKNADI